MIHPANRSLRRLIGAAWVLLFAILACGGPPVSPVVTGTPAATATLTIPPTSTITPTITPTMASTETPSPIPSATSPQPEDVLRIYSVSMADAQTGWAIFTVGGPAFGDEYWLGRTTDGGRTWVNVTPPAARTNEDLVLKVTVLDGETAWAHPSCRGGVDCMGNAVIWRTDDGGRSWRTVPVACVEPDTYSFCLPYFLQFVDEQRGWMLARNFYHNDYVDYLYQTVDGGTTWEKLPGIYMQGGGGYQLAGPSFVDARFGWMGVEISSVLLTSIQANGLPGFEITRDGGRTWETVNLPAAQGLPDALAAIPPSDDAHVHFGYDFQALGEGVVAVCANLMTDDMDAPPFFRSCSLSANRGQTWRPLATAGETFFVDGGIGWRLADPVMARLERTIDGGATWQPFPQDEWIVDYRDPPPSVLVHLTQGGLQKEEIIPVFLPEALWPGRGLRLERLHMDTSLAGWGIEAGGASVCTSDGALTWEICQVGALPSSESVIPDTEGTWSPDAPLPNELFHGGAIPVRLQAEMNVSRQFLSFQSFEPYVYRCYSQRVDQFDGGRMGVSRECAIRYMWADVGAGTIFHTWYYSYYAFFHDEQRLDWPNVVSVDFVDGRTGRRLVEVGEGLYALEQTLDGGSSWMTIKTVGWTGELEFVSPLEGWAIARQPQAQGVDYYNIYPDLLREAVLLHTTDGGRSWLEVHPFVRP